MLAFQEGRVAQLVERYLDMVEVPGSNGLVASQFNLRIGFTRFLILVESWWPLLLKTNGLL